jgi:nitrite reductase (NADH) small subunit
LSTVQIHTGDRWIIACHTDDLTPGRGVAVALPDGRQAALFRTRAGTLHAISNRDPFTGAYVLSRGLLGTAAGRPFVASPLLKQRFDLTDGHCLDDDSQTVPVHPVRTDADGG